jgi:hypothetical protein
LKLIESHKKRVVKIKEFTSKNKLFVLMAIAAFVFLLSYTRFQPNAPQEPQYELCEETGEYIIVVDHEHAAIDEIYELVRWRFYWIDAVILVAGGGFCLVMIMRNRRKTKREL